MSASAFSSIPGSAAPRSPARGCSSALTLLTDGLTRAPAKSTVAHAQTRNVLAEAGRRNAEVLHAMGMAGRMNTLWAEANAKYMQSQQRTADVAGGLGAVSKVFRMALQSGVLALGAYLVIQQEATAGIIIASSILTARGRWLRLSWPSPTGRALSRPGRAGRG